MYRRTAYENLRDMIFPPSIYSKEAKEFYLKHANDYYNYEDEMDEEKND